MLDPRKLKAGWQIQLQQDNKGQWKEYLLNKEGQIVAVEDIKLFEKSKLEASTPNNYEELKKNYTYLSKKEELSPPISISEPTPPFSLAIDEPEDIDPLNCEPPEDDEPDEDRDCMREEDPEISGKEPDPEADRDIDQEIKEQEDRECETKANPDTEEK